MNAATKRRIREVTGDAHADLPDYPTHSQCTKFLVQVPGAYNATAGTDDLRNALELAWEGYRMSEQPAYVWDLRGDGSDFDSTAEPRLMGMVGVFWLDEEA